MANKNINQIQSGDVLYDIESKFCYVKEDELENRTGETILTSNSDIILQLKGVTKKDNYSYENAIKFKSGRVRRNDGGIYNKSLLSMLNSAAEISYKEDGLEFGTFNNFHTSLFTQDYRFNKKGIIKTSVRDVIYTDAEGNKYIQPHDGNGYSYKLNPETNEPDTTSTYSWSAINPVKAEYSILNDTLSDILDELTITWEDLVKTIYWIKSNKYGPYGELFENNLNSTSSKKALTAAQGRVLNSKINRIIETLGDSFVTPTVESIKNKISLLAARGCDTLEKALSYYNLELNKDITTTNSILDLNEDNVIDDKDIDILLEYSDYFLNAGTIHRNEIKAICAKKLETPIHLKNYITLLIFVRDLEKYTDDTKVADLTGNDVVDSADLSLAVYLASENGSNLASTVFRAAKIRDLYFNVSTNLDTAVEYVRKAMTGEGPTKYANILGNETIGSGDILYLRSYKGLYNFKGFEVNLPPKPLIPEPTLDELSLRLFKLAAYGFKSADDMLTHLESVLFSASAVEDLNGDGIVDMDDRTILLNNRELANRYGTFSKNIIRLLSLKHFTTALEVVDYVTGEMMGSGNFETYADGTKVADLNGDGSVNGADLSVAAMINYSDDEYQKLFSRLRQTSKIRDLYFNVSTNNEVAAEYVLQAYKDIKAGKENYYADYADVTCDGTITGADYRNVVAYQNKYNFEGFEIDLPLSAELIVENNIKNKIKYLAALGLDSVEAMTKYISYYKNNGTYLEWCDLNNDNIIDDNDLDILSLYSDYADEIGKCYRNVIKLMSSNNINTAKKLVNHITNQILAEEEEDYSVYDNGLRKADLNEDGLVNFLDLRIVDDIKANDNIFEALLKSSSIRDLYFNVTRNYEEASDYIQKALNGEGPTEYADINKDNSLTVADMQSLVNYAGNYNFDNFAISSEERNQSTEATIKLKLYTLASRAFFTTTQVLDYINAHLNEAASGIKASFDFDEDGVITENDLTVFNNHSDNFVNYVTYSKSIIRLASAKKFNTILEVYDYVNALQIASSSDQDKFADGKIVADLNNDEKLDAIDLGIMWTLTNSNYATVATNLMISSKVRDLYFNISTDHEEASEYVRAAIGSGMTEYSDINGDGKMNALDFTKIKMYKDSYNFDGLESIEIV